MLDYSIDPLTKKGRAAGRNNMFLTASCHVKFATAVSCIHNITPLCQVSTDAKNFAHSAARKRTAIGT